MRVGQYRKGADNGHVYDAVANHGVATLGEFEDWLRLHVHEAVPAG